MPCVEFEPTIPASEREKTVRALDRSATVTGHFVFSNGKVDIRKIRKIKYMF
jgi:hypothetical protein